MGMEQHKILNQYLTSGIVSSNVYIFASENEFLEVIYAFFEGGKVFLNNIWH